MAKLSCAARAVAPEDIRCGDVIAVLHEIEERVPYVTPEECPTRQVRTIQAWILPSYPRAYRVLALSLPFILVEDHDRDKQLLDVRQAQIARLSRAVALQAFPGKKAEAESKAATTPPGPAEAPAGTCPKI